MKIRATIDLKKADKTFNNAYSEVTDYQGGLGSVDINGVCVYWYGSPNYLVKFEDVEVVDDE